MKTKAPTHKSGLESTAYRGRLEALGLVQRPDGEVKPGLLSGIKRDEVAQAAGADGVLSATDAKNLAQSQAAVRGPAASRAQALGTQQTAAVLATQMAVDGLVKSIGQTLGNLKELGKANPKSMDGLVRRAEHLATEFTKLEASMADIGVAGDSTKPKKLAHADPEAVGRLAGSLGKLGGYASELAEQLSSARQMYDFYADGSGPDAGAHKKALAASAAVFRRATTLGYAFGDRDQWSLAFAYNPADGAPVDTGADAGQQALMQRIERDFPGIHDPMYGLSEGEKTAWQSGGAAGLIEHLLGRR